MSGSKRPREEDDNDTNDNDDGGDESRINLYWCTSLRLPAVWYGGAGGSNVLVQPIYCDEEVWIEDEDQDKALLHMDDGEEENDDKGKPSASSSSSSSSGCTGAKSSVGTPLDDLIDGTATTTAGGKTMAQSTTSSMDCERERGEVRPPHQQQQRRQQLRFSLRPRMVPRDTLVPLDDDILRDESAAVATSAVLDSGNGTGNGRGSGSGRFTLRQTEHFVGALLDFAEWDDHLRDSYNWPAFVHDLLRCDGDGVVDADAKITSSSSSSSSSSSGGHNSSGSNSSSSGSSSGSGVPNDERASLARLRAWVSAARAHPIGKHFRDPRKVHLLPFVSTQHC